MNRIYLICLLVIAFFKTSSANIIQISYEPNAPYMGLNGALCYRINVGKSKSLSIPYAWIYDPTGAYLIKSHKGKTYNSYPGHTLRKELRKSVMIFPPNSRIVIYGPMPLSPAFDTSNRKLSLEHIGFKVKIQIDFNLPNLKE